MITVIFCAILAIGAVAVVLWALVTGQVELQGIDGLFLIFTGVIVAAAFGPLLLSSLRQGALRNFLARRRAAQPPDEKEA